MKYWIVYLWIILLNGHWGYSIQHILDHDIWFLMQMHTQETNDHTEKCLYPTQFQPKFVQPHDQDENIHYTNNLRNFSVHVEVEVQLASYLYMKEEKLFLLPLGINGQDEYLKFPFHFHAPEDGIKLVQSFCNQHELHNLENQTIYHQILFIQTIHQYRKEIDDCRTISKRLLHSIGISVCLKSSRTNLGEKNIIQTSCQPISRNMYFNLLSHPEDESVELKAYIQGTDSIAKTKSSLLSLPVYRSCASSLSILSPRKGQMIDTSFDVRVHLSINEASINTKEKQLCIIIGYVQVSCYDLDTIHSIKMETHQTGRQYIQGYIMDKKSNEVDYSFCYQNAQHFVDIEEDPYLRKALLSPLTIATSCNEKDYQEKSIHNLIGSIHVWEPNMLIKVYDFGLSLESRKFISTWKNVEIRDLIFDELPTYFQTLPQTRRIWALYNSLQQDIDVLWMESYMEIRRPLDEIRGKINSKGAFYITNEIPFPSIQHHHHPKVFEYVSCNVPQGSRMETRTELQGYHWGSWAYSKVLVDLITCLKIKDCVLPADSQHPQDLTILSGIHCFFEYDEMESDMKYRLTNSIKDKHHLLQPKKDEKDFNQLVIYHRIINQESSHKPYIQHLKIDDT